MIASSFHKHLLLLISLLALLNSNVSIHNYISVHAVLCVFVFAISYMLMLGLDCLIEHCRLTYTDGGQIDAAIEQTRIRRQEEFIEEYNRRIKDGLPISDLVDARIAGITKWNGVLTSRLLKRELGLKDKYIPFD
jgi:hypothetical protein